MLIETTTTVVCDLSDKHTAAKHLQSISCIKTKLYMYIHLIIYMYKLCWLQYTYGVGEIAVEVTGPLSQVLVLSY